jgi:hypothetical protein
VYTRIDRIIRMLTAVGIAKKRERMEFTDLSLMIGMNMGIQVHMRSTYIKYHRGLECWFLIRARFYLNDLFGSSLVRGPL